MRMSHFFKALGNMLNLAPEEDERCEQQLAELRAIAEQDATDRIAGYFQRSFGYLENALDQYRNYM